MLDLVIAQLRSRERDREIEADLRARVLHRALKRQAAERREALADLEARALASAILATSRIR
jgi:hypothetical protein